MKALLTAILCSILVSTSSAQSFFSATYDIGIPVGNTSEYIGAASFRGFALQSRSFLTDNVSLGGSFGWHIFYENTGKQTFEEENYAINGTQYRYINSLPILFLTHYYTGTDGDLRLYFGGGLGLARVIQRTEIGLYAIENSAWSFALAPEIGLLIPVNFSNAINLSATYHNAFKGGDLDSSTGYLTFKVGFAFMR